jgi:uncharacterized protein (TIGR00369 family)
MTQHATLDRARRGIDKMLGITFSSADRRRVVALLTIEPEHLSACGAIHSGVVATLAGCANSHGAVLNLPPGCATTTLETKANFFSPGAGPVLRAEAYPVHSGRPISIWRATVFRGEWPVAEVTQTELMVDDGGAENETTEPGRRERGSDSRNLASRTFSQSTIDERWRQILEGAAEVIAAKGFAKATIREIAAAAEMPVPTMYQYLERKEDILYNLYKFFMTDIVTALDRTRAREMPPKERLMDAIRTMTDVFDKNHRFIKLMFQETRALTPEARRQVYQLDAQYISIIQELLADATRTGKFRIRNLELAANFVYFLCTIWPLRYWSIGKYGEEAVTNEIIDFVLNGLGARATRRAR